MNPLMNQEYPPRNKSRKKGKSNRTPDPYLDIYNKSYKGPPVGNPSLKKKFIYRRKRIRHDP